MLYIAEKPELGRAIAKGLGGGKAKEGYIDCGEHQVTWCFGHLLELFDPEDYDPAHKKWRMDALPISMTPWKYKPRPKAKAQLKIIEGLLKQADAVVHAGDPDAEGQLLVDEVLGYLGNTRPVKRLLINDLTPALVKRALGDLKDNAEFQGLYQSALARSVADKLYGYNMTRAYTLAARQKGHDGVLSVGRVQTPVLGLVVMRDRQHDSHQKQVYYHLEAALEIGGAAFHARLQTPEGAPVDSQGRITDESYLQEIMAACANAEATVRDAQTQSKSTPPPLPYNLLNLQAEAHKRYGVKPDKTLEITQALRETHHLMTYNRSDCQYLSDEQHGDAPAVLQALGQVDASLAEACAGADASLKSRAFNSANISAHHAIIPTATTAQADKLSTAEQQLYHLIARAYLAQFYPEKQTEHTTLTVDIAGYTFEAKGAVTLQAGWAALYGQEAETDDAEPNHIEMETEEASADLRGLNVGDRGRCMAHAIRRKETKPPPRYTPGTLLKDLASVAKYVQDPKVKKLLQAKDKGKKGEHGGIGTPATRSGILEILIQRGFLAEQGKHLVSTELGRAFFDLLPDKARTPDMTALWHAEQERIEAGEQDVETFIADLMTYLQAEIEAFDATGLNISAKDAVACPACEGGVLRKRNGKNGAFWGCSRYPECKATVPDAKGKPDLDARREPPQPSSEHRCEDCEKPLVRRPTKQDKTKFWWGCTGFPACKRTYRDEGGKPAPWGEPATAESTS